MRVLSVFLSLLLLLIVATCAFFVTKALAPDQTYTPYIVALIVTAALIGASTVFSGVADTAQLIENQVAYVFMPFESLRFKRKYLRHIYYRPRNVDVKGLSTQTFYTLELQDVFVQLRMVPQPIHKLSNQLFQVRSDVDEGSHNIWQFYHKTKTEHPNLAIIGPAGTGKTTLLKHVAISLTATKGVLQKSKIKGKIPCLLFVRDLANPLKEERYDNPLKLDTAIQFDLMRWNLEAPNGWFTKQLEKGNCIIMLDGLDEIADHGTRQIAANWVERQLTAYPKCPFIITSRPQGYRSNPLSGLLLLELLPLDRSQQSKFINNWYFANEVKSQQKDDAGVRMDAQEGAEDLLHRMHKTPELLELAVNPLLLTMIATVHRFRGSLPGRRVELYAEICDVFLGKRQRSKGLILELTSSQRQRVLQPLAWYMMEQKTKEISTEEACMVIGPTLEIVSDEIKSSDFLGYIEHDSGLIVEKESNVHAFAHLTFQEFLASVHACEQKLVSELILHVDEGWWQETIRLYSAQADATTIVEACLDMVGLTDTLPLAVICSNEAMEIQPETRERLNRVLDDWLGKKDVDKVELVSQLKLNKRLAQMERIDERKQIDKSFITQAEYQIFLDDMMIRGLYYQPNQWNQLHYPLGQGNKTILGVRPKEVEIFCNWLTERSTGGYNYNLPEIDDVAREYMDSLSQMENVGYWIRLGGDTYQLMFQGKTQELKSPVIENYLEKSWPDERLAAIVNDRLISLNIMHAIMDTATPCSVTEFSKIYHKSLELAHKDNLDLHDSFEDATDNILRKVINQDHTPDLDRALAFARERSSEDSRIRTLVRSRKYAKTLEYEDAREDILLINALIHKLLFKEYASLYVEGYQYSNGESWIELIESIENITADLFIDLCILEERRLGNLESIEGIRLLKLHPD